MTKYDPRFDTLAPRVHPATAVDVVREAGGRSPLEAAREAQGVYVNADPLVDVAWGDAPFIAPVEPVRRVHVRPDSDSGWGRSTNLLPDGKKPELARIILDVSEPLTISVDVDQAPGLTTDTRTPLTVWAVITFGNGSTSVSRTIRCDYRFDVTVVASFVQLQVFVGDTITPAPYVQNPPSPAQKPAQVSGQVARGIRGLPYVASQFITSDAEGEGQLINGACRVLSFSAHLAATAGAQQFLQFYDNEGMPAPGATPVLEYPLGTAPFPGIPLTRFLNPRGFSQGVYFVVSSASGINAPSGAVAHVELEQLQL